MIRRRGGAPLEGDSSSEEEDDAFAVLSRKSKAGERQTEGSASHTRQSLPPPTVLPVSNTSSMKRHHGTSDTRKAKMEALLQELEAEKESAVSREHFVPDKKGSFVEPWEEHLTTNIFVGNLAPSITEEQMTDLFRQFGDLYSLKIMWPRTPEERARDRHTGFVCFMNREDAEEAMETCNEADPFNVGRCLMLRWGKNVKKIVKKGTGGIAPIRKKALEGSELSNSKRMKFENGNASETAPSKDSSYDPIIHGADVIHVTAPTDSQRLRFITTVASFVAKDGAILEQKLIERESANPSFAFLTLVNSNQQQKEEHIYYRWRVYAFCQGDGFETWRTEPFVMIQPHGKFWIPPVFDREAAWREEQATIEREQTIRQQKAQRRRMAGRKDYMTGRQLEQVKFGRVGGGAADGGARLTDNELDVFDTLSKQKLCASRDTICEAMAFCFEKSGAAKEISGLLKDLLISDAASVDTRVSRLYLLSDILFNSQQPGVKNAFLYRDAIERMAPEVFTSMGMHGNGQVGRMSMNKLRTAVGSVLSAWTNWSVYNPAFINELEARFEGREVPSNEVAEPDPDMVVDENHSESEHEQNANAVSDKPQGDWTEVLDELQAAPEKDTVYGMILPEINVTCVDAPDGETIQVDDIDGEALDDDDIDGEPLSDVDDLDGEALDAKDEGGSAVGADGDGDGMVIDAGLIM